MLYGFGATEGRFDSPPKGFSDAGLDLWSPRSLSDLWAWYSVESLDLSDGDSVSQWDDLSGNGRDVSQGTGADQPTYEIDDAGMPYVDFTEGPHLSMTNTFSTPITALVVAYFRGEGRAGNDEKVGGGGSFYIFSKEDGNVATFNGTHFTTPQTVGLGWVVGCSVTDSSSSELWVNGTQIATGDAGTSSISNWTIGADNDSGDRPFDGGMRELLMFDAHLSQDLITWISEHLMAKWLISPAKGAAGAP